MPHIVSAIALGVLTGLSSASCAETARSIDVRETSPTSSALNWLQGEEWSRAMAGRTTSVRTPAGLLIAALVTFRLLVGLSSGHAQPAGSNAQITQATIAYLLERSRFEGEAIYFGTASSTEITFSRDATGELQAVVTGAGANRLPGTLLVTSVRRLKVEGLKITFTEPTGADLELTRDIHGNLVGASSQPGRPGDPELVVRYLLRPSSSNRRQNSDPFIEFLNSGCNESRPAWWPSYWNLEAGRCSTEAY